MPLRTQIFVFAIGEITKLLPIGNYFQNYLLQESKGTDFGLSSAATTMVVLVEVTVGEALAVYFFSLTFSLIFPLPIDLGAAESSGAGALIAVGAEKSAAVSIVIVNRILSVGSSLLIALVVTLILHGEFRAAMRTTSRRLPPDRAQAPKPPSDIIRASEGNEP